jgi:hypothetical protein
MHAEPSLPPATGAGTGARLPLWLLAAAAGIGAGLVSFGVGEATYDTFKVADAMVYPPGFSKLTGYDKMEVKNTVQSEARIVVEKKKAAVAYGVLGAALGLALGVAGGLVAHSFAAALRGAAVGGLLGAAAGGGLSMVLGHVFFRYQTDDLGFLVLFLTHAGTFLGVGAAAGLGLAFGLNDWSALGRAVFGGLLGALVGTFVLDTAISMAFPLLRTYELVPTEPIPRSITHLGVAVCTALVAGWAAGRSARKS